MLLSMLQNLMLRPRARPTGPRRGRPVRPRLLLEALESRELLSSSFTDLVLAGQLHSAGTIFNPPSPICSTSSTAANVNTDCEGGAGSAPHNETTIAVNPTNSLNMIGSANDFQGWISANFALSVFSRAHVTFDGGHTWTTYPINYQGFDVTGDPAVAFDADGTAYLATLGFDAGSQGIVTGADVVVAHSGDGGKSWSGPVRVASGKGSTAGPGTFNDKDYIAAWGHGNAIVTWTQLNSGALGSLISSPIVASVTHDGGNTWTAPVPITGPLVDKAVSVFGAPAAVPTVAADGSIYVAFMTRQEEVAPEFRDHYKVVKVDPSTGQPLGAPVEVGLVFNGVHDYPINVNGGLTFTYQDSQFRAIPNGNITADPTNALHLAVIYSDMRNNPGGLLTSTDPYQVKTNSDIIVSQSFDGGKTWSAPAAIQQPNDQFQPWGAYNASGRLQIGYYDRSYDPANHKYGYTLASEKAAGSLKFTFQQLTTQLSDPTQGDAFPFVVTVNSNFPKATTFMGDYSGIAVSPTGVGALWTDMRVPSSLPSFPGSSQDAFFADPPAALSAPAPVMVSAAAPSGLTMGGVASLDAVFPSLPDPLSEPANDLWYPAAPANASVPEAANAAVVEAAIWQWASAQQALTLTEPVTDSLASSARSPADSQTSGSVWDQPFIALDVLFQAPGRDG
jgi:hypothetical protein